MLDKNNFEPDLVISHWPVPTVQILSGLSKRYKCKKSVVFHEKYYFPVLKGELKEQLKDIDVFGCRSITLAKDIAEGLALEKLPFVCASGVPEVYSLGDVALITCKKGVGNSGMPSKTWSIMACNTPIIASFDTDSELAEVLEKANAGVTVEPENAEKLANAILEMANGNAAGFTGGREYAVENASKEKCTAKYVETIKQLLN